MTAVWESDDDAGVRLAASENMDWNPGDLVGESQMFLDALAAARRLVRQNAPIILLQGEPGTGRTLFARSIHYDGPAPNKPFIAVQCASLPPNLLEAELFGADATGSANPKPGIFEIAEEGTVFLDEVQALPLPVRRRLATALGGIDGRDVVSCRILCASRSKPDPVEAEGPIAAELSDTLRRNMVELPPLRSRERDVELLARHFLRSWARDRDTDAPVLEAGSVQALYGYPWPGNVRELRETLERAAELAPGRRIGPEHLRIKARRNEPLSGEGPPSSDMILIPAEGKSLEQIEAEAVRATLKITEGNRSAAARILGVSRPTLARKIKKYGA